MNNIKRYLRYVLPYWKRIGLSLFFNLVKLGITLLVPLILQYVIDGILLNENMNLEEKTERFFRVTGVTLFLFLFIRPIVDYYRLYFSHTTASLVLHDIREKAFSHIQRLSMDFYAKRKSGEIISRIVHDVEQTQTIIRSGLIASWIDVISIVIISIIMLTINVKLTILCLVLFPIYIVSVKYFYKRLKSTTIMQSVSLASMNAYLIERVTGISVIKIFGNEEEENKRFGKENKNMLEKNSAHYKWDALTQAVIGTITEAAPILIIVVSGYLVLQSSLTVGAMVAFYAYVEKLFGPLKRLIESITRVTNATASAERVFELLDETQEEKETQKKSLNEVNGDVTFENVSFSYPGEEKMILNQVSLHVKAGETVALVGASGGGKSSLMSLLPRFYEPIQGKILIDGIDSHSLSIKNLRSHIGMALQENVLFSGTIESNILMGKTDATKEEVMKAADLASMHTFISSLPDGYDTEVGERGVKLSGGQRQRIALARLFLKNPSILILDEATSALDLESEYWIQQALEELSKDKTTFIIAHRLNTITHADKIVYLEKGRIAEIGTHRELMKKQGKYYDLFMIQRQK